MDMPSKTMVLLDGPIGVGKSTLGAEMARRRKGAFLDADEFSDRRRSWYCSSLSTNRRILQASLEALEDAQLLFVARAIRCREWVYFRRHLERSDTVLLTLGLHARFDNIVHGNRHRSFSDAEKARIKEMIGQGYGMRPFSNFHVRTDQQDFAATADLINKRLSSLLIGRC